MYISNQFQIFYKLFSNVPQDVFLCQQYQMSIMPNVSNVINAKCQQCHQCQMSTMLNCLIVRLKFCPDLARSPQIYPNLSRSNRICLIMSTCQSNCKIVIISNVMINLAHRLCTDFHYLFTKKSFILKKGQSTHLEHIYIYWSTLLDT